MTSPTSITRPPAAKTESHTQSKGYEVNPDLANIEMAKGLIERLGTPSIVSKPFIVRYGLFSALNHRSSTRDETGKVIDSGNPTGYDCSLRMRVYESVSKNSVNVNGQYFEKYFAYLMKPKYIIQGMPIGQNTFEDNEESLFDKARNLITGNKGGESSNGN
jgi:hypothetical protein